MIFQAVDRFFIFCFVLIFAWGLPINFANSQSSIRKKLIEVPSLTEEFIIPNPVSTSKYEGSVRFELMQYSSPFPEAPELSTSQFLSGRIKFEKESERITGVVDTSAGTFFSLSQSHFAVHELYAGTRTNPVRFYFGRKKYNWSNVDTQWNLGEWQPSFSIDALRPEELGLTGFFVEYEGDKNTNFVAFASPMFIPSQKPDVREENGGLVSDSRWYRRPQRQLNFNGEINSLVYKLDIPEISKLLANPGAGVMISHGDFKNGLFVKGTAGQKPLNELLLKRQTFKDLNTPKLDIKLSPDIGMQTIYGLDVGYSYNDIKATVSALGDQITQKLPEADWSMQSPKDLQAYSLSLEFPIDNLFNRNFDISLSYLKVVGGTIVDIVSSGAEDDITLFPNRTKFTSAFLAQIEGYLGSPFHRKLTGKFKLLHDFDQDGELLGAEFKYFSNQEWALLTGFDLLGVRDETVSESGFLNQFKVNDRIYGGMTYVF